MEIKESKYRFSAAGCTSCSMSGVWRAAGFNQKAVVIFHSPKACAHVTRDLRLSSFYYDIARGEHDRIESGVLLTSDIRDTHSIFGAEERLMECIAYAVRQYDEAAYIMIANSCVVGIIGDDTQKNSTVGGRKISCAGTYRALLRFFGWHAIL